MTEKPWLGKKSPKFKVSSETQGNLLAVIVCKIKIKTDHILQHTMGKDAHYLSEMEKRGHSEGLLDQSEVKTMRANSNLCISTPDVKGLFRSPTPFSFVDTNTLLSHAMAVSIHC